MIIEKPRALPRIAITTLALGGPLALAGCGGGGGNGNAVADYCNHAVNCGASYTVSYCVNYYDNQLSYYDTACQGAIRSALGCVARQACGATPTSCEGAAQNAVSACFSVSSATADYCGHSVICNAGSIYDAANCASHVGNREAYWYSYSTSCGQAYNALNECISNLACGANYYTGCYNAYQNWYYC